MPYDMNARGNRDHNIFGGPVQQQPQQYNPGRHDPTRSSIPGGVFGGSADFLDRLAQAEARDNQMSARTAARGSLATPRPPRRRERLTAAVAASDGVQRCWGGIRAGADIPGKEARHYPPDTLRSKFLAVLLVAGTDGFGGHSKA